MHIPAVGRQIRLRPGLMGVGKMQPEGNGVPGALAVRKKKAAHFQALLGRLCVKAEKLTDEGFLVGKGRLPVGDDEEVHVAVLPGEAPEGQGAVDVHAGEVIAQDAALVIE